MKPFTVSATLCEHFDQFDVMAENKEDAIQKFKDELKVRGLDPWHNHSIEVREVTDTTATAWGNKDLLMWEENRFWHGGAYHYGF
jgi:hypothetical protein